VSLEVQELPDILRVIVLLSFKKGDKLTKTLLKEKVEEYLADHVVIELDDLYEALQEMADEGLLIEDAGYFKLTAKGNYMSKKWKCLLIKREPIMELVAGLTDGTITSLIVIISVVLASLSASQALFAGVLTVTASALSNFSTFMLGGKTEDIADNILLRSIMDYSLRDMPHKEERMKSLKILKHLFIILEREITRSNLLSAIVCSITTFAAGIIPISIFLTLSLPYGLFLSLGVVGAITVVLVYYRSKKTHIHWKKLFIETLSIIALAILISLILGYGI
jgi:VIT1/CCC1 family predicted Fe2+/Mn2+ transporter